MRQTPDIVECFLKYVAEELAYSPLTVSTYRRDLKYWKDYVEAGAGSFVPSDITVNDIRAWVAHMGREGLAAVTMKQRLSAVRAFYRYLIRRHGAEANPAASVKINRRQKTLPKFIDSGEIARVLDSMEAEAVTTADYDAVLDSLIVNILYQTGMRSAEILALTDSRVDMSQCSFKVIGKRNKERIVPFGPNLAALLNEYTHLRPAPAAASADNAFLLDRNGEPLKYGRVYRTVKHALDGRVSAVRKSPHVLRHTFATDMLNGGAELTSVRQLLGHASLAATQIYTHVTAGEIYDNYRRAHPRGAVKKS